MTNPLQVREWSNDLLTDPAFLLLEQKRQSSNLFSILGASHRELWHSAFVKWILDPQDGVGLGTYPLECFLRCLPLCGGEAAQSIDEQMTMEWIAAVAPLFEFTCEFSHGDLNSNRTKKGRARIDVFGQALRPRGDSVGAEEERDVLGRIIIENKVKASETGDQTDAYYQWTEAQRTVKWCAQTVNVFVFLSPSREPGPQNRHFAVMTYQDLYDYVLRRVRSHPALRPDSAFILDHYILNLALPINETGNRPMANTHEEMCRAIYEAHSEVLDLIYSVVMAERGGAPSASKTRVSRSYSVNLTDVVPPGGKLSLTLKNGTLAHATVRADGLVDVVGDEMLSGLTLSSAATKLLNRSANGWLEWTAVNDNGSMIPLKEYRDDYLKARTSTDED